MEVTNPRRILAVSSDDSTQHLARVIKDLTGTAPEQTSTTLAGASHNLSLKTPYYTAEIPIWLDIISSAEEWSASFLSAEAKEVLQVLGGLMVVFALPLRASSDEADAARDLIQQVGKVAKEGLGGWEWDGVKLCLGVGEIDDVDTWEDCCADAGFEFVQVRSQSVPSRNEYGEKTGIPRALEALEANDWANASMDDLGSDFEDFESEIEAQKGRDNHANEEASEEHNAAHLNLGDLNFGYDPKDFEGLRRAIWDARNEEGDNLINKDTDTAILKGDERTSEGTEDSLDDGDIQKIERMMSKLQAVREANAGLPEDQRKRAAAKVVAEVMREI